MGLTRDFVLAQTVQDNCRYAEESGRESPSDERRVWDERVLVGSPLIWALAGWMIHCGP